MKESLTAALRGELEQALLARLKMLPLDMAVMPLRRIACMGTAPAVLRAAYPASQYLKADTQACAEVLWSIGVDDQAAMAKGLGISAPYLTDVLMQAKHCLADHGAWLFATLGPSTLLPLQALDAATVTMPCFATWPTLTDLGDALLATGFARPVLDREVLEFSYADPASALAELQRDGWAMFAGSEAIQQASQLLRNYVRGSCANAGPTNEVRTGAGSNGLPQGAAVTVPFEVIYGLAWKAPVVEAVPTWQPVQFR